MDEMLDVVNELDEVVGQATRSHVHKNQLMHRSTHIMLTNSAGQIFLQLRSMLKAANPGLWDSSAAGHVDAGESYLDCAVRELEEELGIKATASQIIEIGQLPPVAARGFEFVRIYTVQSDDRITLEADEIDDGRWLDEVELVRQMQDNPQEYAPSFIVIWDIFRQWRADR